MICCHGIHTAERDTNETDIELISDTGIILWWSNVRVWVLSG